MVSIAGEGGGLGKLQRKKLYSGDRRHVIFKQGSYSVKVSYLTSSERNGAVKDELGLAGTHGFHLELWSSLKLRAQG